MENLKEDKQSEGRSREVTDFDLIHSYMETKMLERHVMLKENTISYELLNIVREDADG